MLLIDILTHPIVWLGASIITFAHCLSGYGDWLLFVSLILLIMSGEMAVLWANKDKTVIEIRVRVDGKWYVLAKRTCKMSKECEYYTQFSPMTMRIVSMYALLADVKVFVLKKNGKWDVISVP